MRRWLPHRLLFAILLAMWLLMNQSLSPGHIVLGSIVALLSSHAYAALRTPPVRFASLRPIVTLAGIALADIARSNLAVASLVIFRKKPVSAFVRLPLELRSLSGLAVLACIITATPGTIWVQFDRANGLLLVHVLDLVDEDEWIRLIKTRYEALLLEIFGS